MNKAMANALLFIGLLLTARALETPSFVAALVVPFMLYALFANRTHKHRIAGARVLITGGSSGLGRAIAHEAALRGAKQIILVARTASKLENTVKEIQALRSTVEVGYVCADLQSPESIAAMSSIVTDTYGTPDIIVNNAGSGEWLHIDETSPDQALAHTACPYLAAFWVSRAFIEGMITRQSGHIVNITSASSIAGFRGAVTYGTARWAVRGFSQYLRADLASSTIGVTLINAAEIGDTEYFRDEPGKAGSRSHQRIPWLFQLKPVRALSYNSQQTAVASLRAVEQGIHEALIPLHLLVGAEWLGRVAPDALHGLLRLGSAGQRKNQIG